MDIVFLGFATVSKRGVERFMLPCRDVVLLGETKDGCCVQREDGSTYDAVNTYDDVQKCLVDNGIKVINLPVVEVQD